ncbi:MAG TPA: orotate phosphoribosyltransferase [Elusimicrobia bacterium]|nr:orotate phosphoribosyltransferase [Elusimicrobiota bacterium]HBT60616.1 orotate phosphoribosyltransferase [Elusimicrobiota bacterium]
MTNASTLSRQSILGILKETGAMLQGHFLLSSGLHSDRYLQCARLLAHPRHAQTLGQALALLAPAKPDLVLSPALGGIVIGHETARSCGVRALFSEREDGAMTLRRGFELQPGEKVLVVEDVITTGKSTGEVIALARDRGAVVLGALAIVCRAERAPDLGVPVQSLIHLPLAAFPKADCPLCRQGLPLVKPGSRTIP